MKIIFNDLEEIFGSKLSIETKELLLRGNFNYQFADHEERDIGLAKLINFLTQHKKESGTECHGLWENSWEENSESFIASGEGSNLVPKFVRKKELIRFDGNWIIPKDSEFKTIFVMVSPDTIFRENFSKSSTIRENLNV
jgi:hypothetical protein